MSRSQQRHSGTVKPLQPHHFATPDVVSHAPDNVAPGEVRIVIQRLLYAYNSGMALSRLQRIYHKDNATYYPPKGSVSIVSANEISSSTNIVSVDTQLPVVT